MAVERMDLGSLFYNGNTAIVDFLKHSLLMYNHLGAAASENPVTITGGASSPIVFTQGGKTRCVLRPQSPRLYIDVYTDDDVYIRRKIENYRSGDTDAPQDLNNGSLYGYRAEYGIVLAFGPTIDSSNTPNHESWCVIFTMDNNGELVVLTPTYDAEMGTAKTSERTLSDSTSSFYAYGTPNRKEPTKVEFTPTTNLNVTVLSQIPLDSFNEETPRYTPYAFYVPFQQHQGICHYVMEGTRYLGVCGIAIQDSVGDAYETYAKTEALENLRGLVTDLQATLLDHSLDHTVYESRIEALEAKIEELGK